ncbi:MAG: hypothetical protein DRO67_00560 [Candidatus Asgardarchaeum californiense]|nr:MAG: hypothetical protein DRO67_00560 [Candidatus Asgardarchaeum californiense]
MSTFEDEVARSIEKMTFSNNDIVLLKGEWENEYVQELANQLTAMNIRALIVCLPKDSTDLSIIPIKEFYELLKYTEERLGLNQDKYEDDGVVGD